MILSYFGFIDDKFISQKNFDIDEFKHQFPDIDIENYDKLNKNNLFFVNFKNLQLCFITTNPYKKQSYKLETDNILVEVKFGEIIALVEVSQDFKNIINIYRVRNYNILGTYAIIRKSTKIGYISISMKKLLKFIQKNYKKGEILTYG